MLELDEGKLSRPVLRRGGESNLASLSRHWRCNSSGLPGMITMDFIPALFSEVNEQLGAIPTHPEAHLWPSEVFTLGLLHARKGVGNRLFYRWLTRDYRPLFPRLPE